MKKLIFMFSALAVMVLAACRKETPAAVQTADPVKGKMYAFTEEIYGVPSFITIDFGMNGEVSVVNGSLLPAENPFDAMSRITGSYRWDSSSSSIYIKSDDQNAEEGYQAVFSYDAYAKTISISNGTSIMIFEEAASNEDN